MGFTLALVYLYFFVSCIWKYVTTGDITNSTWELILIVMIPVSIGWFARKDESLMIPKMGITGKELPIESDNKSKRKRKKYYFLDSLGLATIFLIFTIVDSTFIQKKWDSFILFSQWTVSQNILAVLALEFLLSMVIFFGITYLWEEWNTKRYNWRLKEWGDSGE